MERGREGREKERKRERRISAAPQRNLHCAPRVLLTQTRVLHVANDRRVRVSRYWFYNAAQKFSNGVWYSTLAEGECDERASGSSNSSANDAPCFWRLASTIKRVSKTCHDSKVFEAVETVGKERFDVCKQPLDRKGECWTLAFYDTFLGACLHASPHHDARIHTNTALPTTLVNFMILDSFFF